MIIITRWQPYPTSPQYIYLPLPNMALHIWPFAFTSNTITTHSMEYPKEQVVDSPSSNSQNEASNLVSDCIFIIKTVYLLV